MSNDLMGRCLVHSCRLLKRQSLLGRDRLALLSDGEYCKLGTLVGINKTMWRVYNARALLGEARTSGHKADDRGGVHYEEKIWSQRSPLDRQYSFLVKK